MTHKLKFLSLLPVILLVAFTLMPTGATSAEVMAGYGHTTTYSSYSGASYRTYLTSTATTNGDLPDIGEQIVADATGSCTDYVWLTSDGEVADQYLSSGFPFRNNKTEIHRANDWVSHDAAPLYQVAIWGGTVKKIGCDTEGWGNYVVIEVNDHFQVVYAHLRYNSAGQNSARDYVAVNDIVSPGDIIGIRGSTGRSSGEHAHVELRLYPKGTGVGFCYWTSLDWVFSEGGALNAVPWLYIPSKDDGVCDVQEVGTNFYGSVILGQHANMAIPAKDTKAYAKVQELCAGFPISGTTRRVSSNVQ